jgi:hypothetical protein
VKRAALLALFVSGVAHAAPDYAPGSSEWNGLAQLLDLSRQSGCDMVAEDELDWSSLKKSDILWFVYPRAQVEPGKLSRFLAAGGRVVVADDFGAAGPALEKVLHLRRGDVPPGIEHYHDNPNLPIARSRVQTALGRSAEELVSNHSRAFQTGGMTAPFEFTREDALVVEEHFSGGGYAVAIADPSLFINNMLEIDGNRAFAAALVAETCPTGGKIHLLTQAFLSRGEPPGALDDKADPGSSATKFNDLIDKFNQNAKLATGDRRATIMLGLAAGLIASFLLLGAFAARGLIRDRWTKVGRIADPLERHPLDEAWDLAGPMGVLRAEVLDRLTVALGGAIDFAWLGPTAIEQRVAAKLGPNAARHAGELWRLLKKIRWREVEGDVIPDERIARRQLMRAHALATALFDELERN